MAYCEIVEQNARSYATRQRAEDQVLKHIRVGQYGVVNYLIAVRPDGRFVPVVMPTEAQVSEVVDTCAAHGIVAVWNRTSR